MKDSELLTLSLEEAQQRKWAEGRTKHGPEWYGERPLIQGFGELVDLLNYVEEDEIQGFITHDQADALRIEVQRLAEAVRMLCRPPGEPL